MLEQLLTEQRNPASAAIDTAGTEAALRIINREDAKVAAAVEREIPAIARAVEAIAGAIERESGYSPVGTGTSGRLGVLDAAEHHHLGTTPELVTGIIAGGEAASVAQPKPAKTMQPRAASDLARHGFTARDVLVGLAASGRTPYVLGAIAEARRLSAVTVGISCTTDSELAQAADIAIIAVGIIERLRINLINHGMIYPGRTIGNDVLAGDSDIFCAGGADERRREQNGTEFHNGIRAKFKKAGLNPIHCMASAG